MFVRDRRQSVWAIFGSRLLAVPVALDCIHHMPDWIGTSKRPICAQMPPNGKPRRERNRSFLTFRKQSVESTYPAAHTH
ncbi:hypothetical protein BLOT_006621 [Blomia tropicalis]|nr:hypothetical protein BLOT_006621 [Blomia tropicalis]